MTAISRATPSLAWQEALVLPPGAFRLLLASAVVVSHVSRFSIGRLAVLLFFLLSGYWTARVFQEKFAPTGVARFYAARYLRIIPLYLIFMLLAAFLRRLPIYPVNFTLLGVASGHQDPTGVSWSLDVELQFYLLLPIVVLLAARMNRFVFLAASIAVSILGIWLASAFGVVTALKYLPAFALGVLIYVAKWRPSANVASLSLIGFVAMTAVTAAFTPFLTGGRPDPFDRDIWGFFWMLPLTPYVARSLMMRSTKLDRHFGNLSYPLYLTHFSMLAWAYSLFGHATVGKAVGVLLAVTAALVAYILIDRPVDAWRVRVTEGQGK